MPEFFLELFSEEIPAWMQPQGAMELARFVNLALAPLTPSDINTWYSPRRIAFKATVLAEVPVSSARERGPRMGAPDAALSGFAKKHGKSREDLSEEGDFHYLYINHPARPAAALIAEALPPLLRNFPWPKSMRWGTSAFTWVRPLRRIVALLDGAVVPFTLATEGDPAHGLASSNLTEGHRVHAPGAFAVEGAEDWAARLRDRSVLVSAADRRQVVHDGLTRLASARDLTVVDDPGLLDEVANLCEWPVPLLGPIDAAYMDLPPEVLQVSMRVNQRYFALRHADGTQAPWFGFAANIEASDNGAAIVAGNARVLRARFSDARHFWDADRRLRLEDRLDALKGVTFHAKLGTQYDRAKRLESIARALAPSVNADPNLCARAGLLAKADLTTSMVAEFPELQGVMGGYYARHDGESDQVALAITEQYEPFSDQGSQSPIASASIAVGLADRIDTLWRFFAIGETPTGSGDPYALRRAALGIIRLTRDNDLNIDLLDLCEFARLDMPNAELVDQQVTNFILERLRVLLRGEGKRHDILSAILSAHKVPDVVNLLAATEGLTDVLGSADGRNLLVGYRRAANILRIEDRKDGPHGGSPDKKLLLHAAESQLVSAFYAIMPEVERNLRLQQFVGAMAHLATLRAPLDAFFEAVMVNASDPALRRNRLRILASVKSAMDQIADFSKIVEQDTTP